MNKDPRMTVRQILFRHSTGVIDATNMAEELRAIHTAHEELLQVVLEIIWSNPDVCEEDKLEMTKSAKNRFEL